MSSSLAEAISYLFESDFEKASQVLLTLVYTFPPSIKNCLTECPDLADLLEAYKFKAPDLRTLSKILINHLVKTQYKKGHLSQRMNITEESGYYEFGRLIGDTFLEVQAEHY